MALCSGCKQRKGRYQTKSIKRELKEEFDKGVDVGYADGYKDGYNDGGGDALSESQRKGIEGYDKAAVEFAEAGFEEGFGEGLGKVGNWILSELEQEEFEEKLNAGCPIALHKKEVLEVVLYEKIPEMAKDMAFPKNEYMQEVRHSLE